MVSCDAGAMYFLYLQLGLASLMAITVLILLMPLQVCLKQRLGMNPALAEPSHCRRPVLVMCACPL